MTLRSIPAVEWAASRPLSVLLVTNESTYGVRSHFRVSIENESCSSSASRFNECFLERKRRNV